MALFQKAVNVKPTLATTREKRTIGTINYAEQAGEVDDEDIPGNKISSGSLFTCTPVCTKRVMIFFVSAKRNKPDPKPVESSSGKVFTRKPPNKPEMGSTIPVIIEPKDEGAYQLPA